MPVLQRVKKPTTRKGKKVLLSREPQVIEHVKQTVYLRGHNVSQLVVNFMKDLHMLKRPHGTFLGRKNDILPFEDITPVEGFSRKYEAAFFAVGTHNKKRPHNLIIGRTFDHQLLDMVELGIESYKQIKEFKTEKISSGCKPCIVFVGEAFEQQPTMIRLRNLLTDMFHREPVQSISLQGLEHALVFTAHEGKIYMRSYRVLLKKSGQKTPRIELEEIGPSANLVLRRDKLASDSLFREACKTPKELKIKKTKNIDQDSLGTTHGRIHVPKQNVDALQTRKMKGLKKTAAERREQRLKRSQKNSASAEDEDGDEDEAMDQDE